jgi:hypothetical protein
MEQTTSIRIPFALASLLLAACSGVPGAAPPCVGDQQCGTGAYCDLAARSCAPLPRGFTLVPAASAIPVTVSRSVRLALQSVGGATWRLRESGPAAGALAQDGTYAAPAAPGVFHAVATSTADPGQSAEVELDVLPFPEQPEVVAPSAVRAYADVTLSVAAPRPDIRYSWIADGAAALEGERVTLRAGAPGQLRITCRAVNAAGDYAERAVTITSVGAPASSASTFGADVDDQVADGVASVALTLQLRDQAGAPVADEPVAFASSVASDVIAPAAARTDAQGVATASLRSLAVSSSPHDRVVTASFSGSALTVALTFLAGAPAPSASSMAPLGGPLVADGAAAAPVIVILQDAAGNPVGGWQVLLSSSGGDRDALTPAAGRTDTDGVFTASIASTLAGAHSVQATVTLPDGSTFTLSQGIAFIAGAPAAATTTAAPEPAGRTPVADGTPQQLRVKLRDAYGNAVPGAAVVRQCGPRGGGLALAGRRDRGRLQPRRGRHDRRGRRPARRARFDEGGGQADRHRGGRHGRGHGERALRGGGGHLRCGGGEPGQRAGRRQRHGGGKHCADHGLALRSKRQRRRLPARRALGQRRA